MAQTVTLNTLRDVARPLLIFSPANDPRLATQFEELEHHMDGAAERDLRVMVLTPQPATLPGNNPPLLVPTSPTEQAKLRQTYQVAPESFAVVLIGKDGGEKLRSGEPIPWSTLTQTIDAMPMRKDEMKHNR